MTDPHEYRCVLSGTVSSKSAASINVIGPWGAREARNVIRILEMQIAWLEEDEAMLTTGQTAGKSDG